MLSELQRKQKELEEKQQELKRKRSVLARLKDNLSDENKEFRRQRYPNIEDVVDEEQSITRQITKFEAEIREAIDAS